MEKATAVLILGMHRSGTSCLAGSLQQHGLFLGKVFEWSPHNQKGNRENAEIMQLNDEVLANTGHSWDNPTDSIKWTIDQTTRRDQIVNGYHESGHLFWGFKDPRTLFTLKFWQDGLKDTNIRCIGTYRHPIAVSQSLWHRNKMPLQDGLLLWAKYNSQMLRLQKEVMFPLISFDVDSGEYQQSITRILPSLQLVPKSVTEDLFFNDALRKVRNEKFVSIPNFVVGIYEELNEIYQEQMA